MTTYYITEKQLRDFEYTAGFTNDKIANDQTYEISLSVEEIRKNQKLI